MSCYAHPYQPRGHLWPPPVSDAYSERVLSFRSPWRSSSTSYSSTSSTSRWGDEYGPVLRVDSHMKPHRSLNARPSHSFNVPSLWCAYDSYPRHGVHIVRTPCVSRSRPRSAGVLQYLSRGWMRMFDINPRWAKGRPLL